MRCHPGPGPWKWSMPLQSLLDASWRLRAEAALDAQGSCDSRWEAMGGRTVFLGVAWSSGPSSGSQGWSIFGVWLLCHLNSLKICKLVGRSLCWNLYLETQDYCSVWSLGEGHTLGCCMVPPQRMEKLREPGKGERGGGEGAYNQRFVCVILLNPLHNFRRQALREDYVACPRSCMETGSNADLSDSTPSPSGCGLFPLG